MSKRKSENYLEKCPVRSDELSWSADSDGNITIDIENKGVMNRIAQKLLKKPRISHIHLDEIGSFVWPLIDGNKNIIDIGKEAEEHFGDRIKPTYERLAKYFRILESCKFIKWKE
ncbi:MAG: PqqD family protein [Oscillospiraceae bacterium]|nr:PqqD family protein [Oscillospiraceae bacterium]